MMGSGKSSIGSMVSKKLNIDFVDVDHEIEKNKETQIIKKWKKDLFDLKGIETSEHEDWTGNPITRLKIKIDPQRCFANAWEISSRLKNLNPSIVVRDDLIENQEFFLDPCNINQDEIGLVSDSIIKVLNDFKNDPERKKILGLK